MTLKEQMMKLQTYKMHEGEDTVYVEREDVLKALEQQPCYNPDEWCHNCKEYDQDKHCCPMYNNVIRKAVDEIPKIKTGHWIPVSERLPEKGVQVLCCNKHGSVFTSCITYRASGSGIPYFGQHYDVIAWMPLPEPYKEKENE